MAESRFRLDGAACFRSSTPRVNRFLWRRWHEWKAFFPGGRHMLLNHRAFSEKSCATVLTAHRCLVLYWILESARVAPERAGASRPACRPPQAGMHTGNCGPQKSSTSIYRMIRHDLFVRFLCAGITSVSNIEWNPLKKISLNSCSSLRPTGRSEPRPEVRRRLKKALEDKESWRVVKELSPWLYGDWEPLDGAEAFKYARVYSDDDDAEAYATFERLRKGRVGNPSKYPLSVEIFELMLQSSKTSLGIARTKVCPPLGKEHEPA